jgi:CHAD domain-containing protein
MIAKRPALSQVARDVLRGELSDWQRAADAFLRSPGPDPVHILRVTGRRLRAALKMFRSYMPRGSKSADGTLAWMGEKLGAVRDLDVHLIYVRRKIERASDGRRAALIGYEKFLRRRLASARRMLARALAGARSRRLIDSLETLAAEMNRGSAADDRAGVRRLLKKPYRRLKEASRKIRSDPSEDALHEFRRVLRKLRYGCEFLEPASPRLKHVTIQLRELQSEMGALQDRVLAPEMAADYLSVRNASVTRKEAKALRRLVDDSEKEKEDLRRGVLNRWRKSGKANVKRLMKLARAA